MKEFNTTAVCIPSKHYMIDISDRIKVIRQLVDDGKYITINRARQYGKTTTLMALRLDLTDDYIVLLLDFQRIDKESFRTGGTFSKALARIILDLHEFENLSIPDSILTELDRFNNSSKAGKMDDLFRILKRWMKDSVKSMVMIIDEVDSASDNQVFLDFLSLLRDGYISREAGGVPAFHSVILAGVTDIKHLRTKIRDDKQHKLNSPWNIATDLDVDMSLSEAGIKAMLDEYDQDHHIGIKTKLIAKYVRDYTGGYPFLVSRICELLDHGLNNSLSLSDAWTERGVDEAVKNILSENNTLFQSVTGKLNNYPELRKAIRSILMEGTKLTWNAQQEAIVQLQMYGLIRNDHNTVRIANRIFETMLYNLFLSDEEIKNNEFSRKGEFAKNQFVEDGKLNMRLILERFIETYTEICGPLKERFKEKDGRELFLLYIKPIINGTGNYYIEAQTRDQTRTDVIIDYLGKQYIIELKIWRGERYNEEGEKQISEYLDYYGLDTGYMLSFNFNKKKEQGVKRVQLGSKILFEGTL